VSVEPSLFCVGGVQSRVAVPEEGAGLDGGFEATVVVPEPLAGFPDTGVEIAVLVEPGFVAAEDRPAGERSIRPTFGLTRVVV
jgi:hypothetical protein